MGMDFGMDEDDAPGFNPFVPKRGGHKRTEPVRSLASAWSYFSDSS